MGCPRRAPHGGGTEQTGDNSIGPGQRGDPNRDADRDRAARGGEGDTDWGTDGDSAWVIWTATRSKSGRRQCGPGHRRRREAQVRDLRREAGGESPAMIMAGRRVMNGFLNSNGRSDGVRRSVVVPMLIGHRRLIGG